MSSNYFTHYNDVILGGKAKQLRLYPGEWPSLNILVTGIDPEGLNIDHWVKISLKKDSGFIEKHDWIKDKSILVRCTMNSWDKDGETNYGLKSSQARLTICKEGTPEYNLATITGKVYKKGVLKKEDIFVYQIGMDYRVPNRDGGKPEIKTRFARVSTKEDIPEGSTVSLAGKVENNNRYLVVRASWISRID